MEFTTKANGTNQHQSRGEMFCRGQSTCLFPKPCFLTDRYVNVYARSSGCRGGQTAGRSSSAPASQAGWVPSARMAFRELEALAGWLREQIAWEKKIASFVIFLIIVTPLDFVPGERSRVTMEHTQTVSISYVVTSLSASDLRCAKHSLPMRQIMSFDWAMTSYSNRDVVHIFKAF